MRPTGGFRFTSTLHPYYTFDMLEIRPFRTTDETAVVNLWTECNLVVPWNNPHTDIERKTSFQPDLFFVALSGGKIIGTVMAGYEGHRGWINYLAVAPNERKKGYGRDIVDYAVEKLKNLGCQKVNLQVRRSNTGVIGFYQAIGFKEDDVMSLGLRLTGKSSSE